MTIRAVKNQATKDNIQNIYVALQGDKGGTWNAANVPKFWSDALVHVENNLCVDTTRDFVAGFSFEVMFSCALSLVYPGCLLSYNGTGDNLCDWVNNAG